MPTKQTKEPAKATAEKVDAKATTKAEAAKPAAKKTTTKTAAAKTPAKKTTTKTTAAAKPAAKPAAKSAAKATTTAKPAAAAKPATKPAAKATTTAKPATKPAAKATTTAKATAKPAAKATTAAKAEPAATKTTKTAAKKTTTKAAAKKTTAAEAKPAAKPAAKKTTAAAKAAAPKKVEEPKVEAVPAEEPKVAEPVVQTAPEPKVEAAPAPVEEPKAEATPAPAEEPQPEAVPEPELPQPRRSIAFIGSECYPFVKTGGLGDVMYALPKALAKLNCDVKVILPNYSCIKQEWKDKMVYRGSFYMDLCSDGRQFYVGIMEYVWDDVVYDFIDNEEFFSNGNPYTNLVDDIPKFCYFGKAALAALNFMDWVPDVIHCHDWQAGLIPIYLRTMFASTPLAHSKVVTTIHNLRFQGKYNIPTIKYWSNIPDNAFNMGALQEEWTEANMLKGGLAYSDLITTVSGTYAGEIQTWEYGEGLDAHLRHHSGKLRGIVNGIDIDIWNPETDELLDAPYSTKDAIEKKKANKLALQKELGLEENADKFVIGLVSRLTNQKGLDLVNAIVPQIIDGNTELVVLGTGDPQYEDSFRYYENEYKGQVCSYIAYDEALSHKIYAACDAFLVPSQFEPCGLTQLIAMHYGTAPIVRETGGLKDTVEPYNQYENTGNGFTFDRYESGLLLDAINRAKTLYFENREAWDQMVIRDMEKDVSWENSAQQYRQLYVDITQ